MFLLQLYEPMDDDDGGGPLVEESSRPSGDSATEDEAILEMQEEDGSPDWIPVELEMVSKMWLPDSEILRLKGFHSLSVLDRLQVRQRIGRR